MDSLEGMIILSGYQSELYQGLFASWECRKKDTFADGGKPRVECLWLNEAASANLNSKTMSLFEGAPI